MLVTCSGWLEVGNSSTCTMGVGLVTSTRQNSFEGCIKITPHCIPAFYSKGIHPMASWQLPKLATGQMHYSSSRSLHHSEEQRENIKFLRLGQNSGDHAGCSTTEILMSFSSPVPCLHQALNHATLSTTVARRVPWSNFHREQNHRCTRTC